MIGEEEKQALREVIESGRLFRYGKETDPTFLGKVWTFEQEAAKFLEVRHTVAVNSGTSALLVALGALGIGPGDEVIVPGYTFVASIGAIVYARAVPVLAEIDESLTLNPQDVREKLTPRTKAIMLVHMLGSPGRIAEIRAIADEHKVLLIEDCAQAFGATYRGRPVGSHGHAGTHSFNVFKIITAGDGGMIGTSDHAVYSRAFALHDQGHLPLRKGVEQGNRAIIGLDFRMTELSAAVLLAQLAKMGEIKKRLKERRRRFRDGIKDLPGIAFRKLPDPEGDLGTVLTVLLPDERTARALGKALGTKPIADSGWHVYNNMEHILEQKTPTADKCPFTCPRYKGRIRYEKGMLPKTDAILRRAINISIGVADAGLGAAFGVTVISPFEEVDGKVEQFRACYRQTVG